MAVVEMHKQKAKAMQITQLNGTQLQCLNLFVKSVQEANKPEPLSEQEQTLLEYYRKSDEHARKTLIQLAKVHAG